MTLPPLPWNTDLEAWLEVRDAAEIERAVSAYGEACAAAMRERCAKQLEALGCDHCAAAIRSAE